MPGHINPINSLAFSMYANKGVYALLLGSGVSRSSQIPTGWEITLDLVRKIAVLNNAECGPDPAAWYQATYGKQPDYSDLLDVLCKSQPERQQLIRTYLEPTPDEREENIKQPTDAHRAISQLVKAGYIRVLLTTNFDKLMELALHDVGVVPTVLSTPDHIAGALPLVHTACTIIKIHGDYLDTRIKNTADELADYPTEFKALLDRVFDEYGLVVCGWSAEWDEALRDALVRAPYRRFSSYWASRGEPESKAKDIIQRKAAHVITIEGADPFFSKLSELVTALDTFSQPHPLSVDAAVATIKKYLSEPKYKIQYNDLISSEIDHLVTSMKAPPFDNAHSAVDSQSLQDRANGYEAASTILTSMGAIAGFWAKGEQLEPWRRAIARLAIKEYEGGLVVWIGMQRYPACLLIYALGLGAIASGNTEALSAIFSVEIVQKHQKNMAAVIGAHPVSMFENGTSALQGLPGKSRVHLPFNSWIEDYFKPLGTSIFQSEQAYIAGFEKLEFFWTLAYAHASREEEDFWVPMGNFIYRRGRYANLMAEIQSAISADLENSIYVRSRIFGSTAKDCTLLLEKIDPIAQKWQRQWH